MVASPPQAGSGGGRARLEPPERPVQQQPPGQARRKSDHIEPRNLEEPEILDLSPT